jgi:hypothetical protein
MFSTLKVQKIQKFVWRLPDGNRPESLKNNRIQAKSENLKLKEEVSRLKGKKNYGIKKFADRGGPNEILFSSKITFFR